jgi:hypothetical protein
MQDTSNTCLSAKTLSGAQKDKLLIKIYNSVILTQSLDKSTDFQQNNKKQLPHDNLIAHKFISELG